MDKSANNTMEDQNVDTTINQDNTAIDERYFLGVGVKGFERLALQHQLLGKHSQHFLTCIGLSGPMHVLEVGAGVRPTQKILTKW